MTHAVHYVAPDLLQVSSVLRGGAADGGVYAADANSLCEGRLVMVGDTAN